MLAHSRCSVNTTSFAFSPFKLEQPRSLFFSCFPLCTLCWVWQWSGHTHLIPDEVCEVLPVSPQPFCKAGHREPSHHRLMAESKPDCPSSLSLPFPPEPPTLEAHPLPTRGLRCLCKSHMSLSYGKLQTQLLCLLTHCTSCRARQVQLFLAEQFRSQDAGICLRIL